MINECEILKSLYKVRPYCLNRYCGKIKSYRNNGCLIAHTILALKEFNLISKEVINILINSLIRLLRSEPRHRSKDIMNVSKDEIEKYLTKLMEITIVFHDIGKMARGYLINLRDFRHEISSWIHMLFIKDVFNKALNMRNSLSKVVSGYKLYEQAALAILLHHESIIWASVEEYGYLGDIIYEVVHKLYKYSKYSKNLLLDMEMLKAFYDGLKHTVDLGLLSSEVLMSLEGLIKRYEELAGSIRELIPKYSAILNSNRDLSSNRLTFPIYYTLFIVDNRAASCRENINNYWRIKYEKVVKAIKKEGNYELLVNMLRTELSNDITFHVSLSLIPRVITI